MSARLNKNAFILIILFLFVNIIQSAYCQTKEKIDSAIINDNVVFLVVCKGNYKLNEAKLIADEAQKKAINAVVVVLDKSSKSNATLVSKYQLSNMQTPGILVIASNGVVAKRFLLNEATVEKLLGAIPSPKQAEVWLASTQGKSVFLVLSKKTLSDKNEVVKECEKSCIAMQNNAIIVDIDIEDPLETKYLKSLNTDFSAEKTKVLVFNTKGKFTMEYEAPVLSSSLINASMLEDDCPCLKGSKNNNKK